MVIYTKFSKTIHKFKIKFCARLVQFPIPIPSFVFPPFIFQFRGILQITACQKVMQEHSLS